ncbi:MAG: HAD family phosphatase [Aquisalimonadaceae bacterium]
MPLAIFDLDNTLLAGDSDFLWGRFLVDHGFVDAASYDAANRRFYEQYNNGELDINEFLRFSLQPLTLHPAEVLHGWRQAFVDDCIRPLVLPAARELVNAHAGQGHTTVIISATNRFVTEPIAALFGVDALLSTTPEFVDGRYTGRVIDTPTFREGKVTALENWLRDQDGDLSEQWFYSDSHNDLPLLQQVTHPVAVDPDETLREEARRAGWPIISLREPEYAGAP